MLLKLTIVGFLIASLALVLWLLASGFAYAMLDFACLDGHKTACDGTGAREIALHAGLGVAAWAVWALLLVRAWKRC